MKPFSLLKRGLRSLWQRRQAKREIDEELRFHLEQRAAENQAAGMSPGDAEREARKRFGNWEGIREECRAFRGADVGEDLARDIRFAVRQLLKTPGFTAVAILSLALGIGANTAVFSVVNALLLRSLPVRDAGQLRLINWVGRNPQYSGYTGPGTIDKPNGFTLGTSFSYPAYCLLRDQTSGFSDIFAFFSRTVTVVGQGEPAVAGAMLVSGNYFSGYGRAPMLGRSILLEDDRPNAAPVAVISYRWWEQHCGLDPKTIGRGLTINNVSFTVVGVLPRDYLGPTAGDPSDIYVPLSTQPLVAPAQPLDSPHRFWLQLMGRLAPGVNEAQVQASLTVLFRQALGQSRTRMEEGGIELEDGSSGQLMLKRQMAKPFFVLAGVVGVVLLIACANLAGLLLARGASRQHELAIRAALGASRWRLVRQSLIESLMLSFGGAGLGLAIAALARPALLGALALRLDDSRFDFGTDLRVLAFTLGVSLLTGLVFGLWPALVASRVDPAIGLKPGTAVASPRLSLGKVLVVLQAGLSVLLVVGAGLMVRTFANLARVEPGFNPEHLMVFRVRPGDSSYRAEQFIDLYDRIREAITAIPGVQSVSHSAFPLVSGSSSSDDIQFPDAEDEAGRRRNTAFLTIGEGFFRTLSIPLMAGRDFTTADTATTPPVVIVNETFVRKYFPGQNPLGKTFLFCEEPVRKVEIVGVARDAKYNRIRADHQPLLYLSQRQRATRGVSFAVRSALPPSALASALRRAVASIDPRLPLSGLRTQKDLLNQSIALDRLFAGMTASLAGLAVLLSCIGVYGLMAYSVARRTREIGLRMALGAVRQQITGPILREALLLAGCGVAAGLPAALALVRLVKSQLYGIAPADPLALFGAATLLFAVALLSAWLPARRAARVDPIKSLRTE